MQIAPSSSSMYCNNYSAINIVTKTSKRVAVCVEFTPKC